MDDEVRRWGTGNSVLPGLHKGRRSKAYRILSMVLVALMVLVQPLESFAANVSTYRVTFYDSIKKDPEEGHEINNRYCHFTEMMDEGSELPKLEEPYIEGYHFLGWYKSEAKPWSYQSGEPYDLNQPVTSDLMLYANYWVERTDANTITLTDGYSDTILLKKLNASVRDEKVYFKFTPEVTDKYKFAFNASAIRYQFFGENYVENAGAEGKTAKYWEGELEAGKTYYWSLWFVPSASSKATEWNTPITFQAVTTSVPKKEINKLTITPDTLSNHVYTGSEIIPSEKITVKDGDKTLTEGKDYKLVYKNNINVSTAANKAAVTIQAIDSSDYTGSFTKYFWITKAAKPSNTPNTYMEADYNVKTVGDVTLPDGWIWQEADRTKALVSEETVTAMAEYTGSDKANYTTITVSIDIRRKSVVITDFTLNESNKALKAGEGFKLEISSITPSDAEEFSVNWQNIWSSNDTKVATVDKDGNVKAVSTGTAVITAKINSISRTCTVKVTNPVTDFHLNKEELSLKGGETQILTPVTTPANPDAYTVMWSSSDSGVAMVDNSGIVKAAGTGTATITAVINGISRTCTVAVTNPLTGFTLNKENVTLTEGNSETIYIASTTPANPDAYTVTYSSSDSSVADVLNGKITAKNAGMATISVKIHNGTEEIINTCQVTVTAPTSENLTGIQIIPEHMDLKAGQQEAITVMPEPSGAVIGNIEYSLSNQEGIVEVNADTGIVTAKKTGTVEIAVKAGGFEKTCTVTVSNPVTGFALNKTAVSMQIGNRESLSVISIVPENADPYTVKWESDNQDIASVNESGEVEAKAGGTAVITAVINGLSRSCTVMVEKPEPILVSKIVLDTEEKTIDRNETFQIKIMGIEPETADNKEVEWISSDPLVATVDENGNVTGVAAGQAVIMAMAKDESGISASCKVIVNNPVINFELDKTSMTMKIGEKERISIIPSVPEEADSYTVRWKSNNPDIASVNENGEVEARSEGIAVITAEINGNSRSCTVTVHQSAEPVFVSKIVLDSAQKTIDKNGTFQIKIIGIEPETADNKEVEWISSNPLVATVDENGNVTGIMAGNAVIRAVAKDGSGTDASCMVTVKEEGSGKDPDITPPVKDPDVIPPGTGDIKVISLKITGQTKKVAPGKKIALTCNVYPENAANKQIVWKVSNSKYASVNSKGIVTVKKAAKGKKITVTAVSAENNSIKAVYKITVMKQAVKKIKLTGKKTLKVGKSMKIKVRFTPSKGISKELTWTSSNKKIAEVNSKGKVTAKAKGKVKITAKAKDGSGKKASIKIQVK